MSFWKLPTSRAIPLAAVATENPKVTGSEVEHMLLPDCLELRISLASECLTPGNWFSEQEASHLSCL